MERVDFIEKYLGLKIGELIADRGYGSAENLEKLEEKNIKTNIPFWSSRSGETFFRELDEGFAINKESQEVRCPQGHRMKNSCRDHTTEREIYTLPRPTCMACPRAQSCLTAYEYKMRSKRFI